MSNYYTTDHSYHQQYGQSYYYPPPPQAQYGHGTPQGPYYPPPQPNGVSAYPPPNGSPQAAQPPSYQQEYAPPPPSGSVQAKINTTPRYNDVWAAALWLLNLAAFVAVSVLSIKAYISNEHGQNVVLLNAQALTVMAIAVAVGFVLSIMYLFLMQRFPKQLIYVAWIFSIILYFAAAAYFLYLRSYIAGIIWAVFAIIYLMTFFWWRNRVPFAVIMLETVTGVTRQYYGTIAISLAGLVVELGFSIWFIITLVGAYYRFGNQAANCTQSPTNPGQINCPSNASLVVVIIFLIFSFYWTSQVIKTVIHVTVAGVFGVFYFLVGTDMAPKSPTLASLGRAMTTSFGSICFGSLIIAIISLIRTLLQSAAQNNDSSVGAFLACIAGCILGCIEGLIEYFNFYAYTEVALFGKSFCQAAKDTWTLIKDRGIEAIINDNLVGHVTSMGNLLIGAVTALVAYGYLEGQRPAFNQGGAYTVLIVLICLLIGIMMGSVVGNTVDSGTATTFVALAEDPEALRRTKPQLYDAIARTWPRVVQGV